MSSTNVEHAPLSPKAVSLAILSAPARSMDGADAHELELDIRTVGESPVLAALLAMTEGGLLVLDSKRRIIAASLHRLLPQLPDASAQSEQWVGLRPGDALECHFAPHSPEGCGSSEACRDCGIAGAVIASQAMGQPIDRECLLTVGEHLAPLELRARAAPIAIGGRNYIAVSLRDISSEKRRESLEQVFFHDLMNTVAALSGWTWTLTRPATDGSNVAIERVSKLVEQLGREVAYQRALLEAERGRLRPERVRVFTGALVSQVQAICAHPGEARKCSLVVDNRCPDLEIVTDPLLLERVLVNMVKNAIEATQAGGAVRLTCEATMGTTHDSTAASGTAASGAPMGTIRFRVHNDAFIPERIAMRLFQRSFTTKPGKGRGLGTYSMKLLGERYLGGRVFFTSTPEEGTDFYLELDRAAPPL